MSDRSRRPAPARPPTTEEIRNALTRTREVRPIDFRCYFRSTVTNEGETPSEVRASNATISAAVVEVCGGQDRRRTFRKIVTYVEKLIDVRFPRDEELLMTGLGGVLFEAARSKPNKKTIDERIDELAKAHERHEERVTGEYSFRHAFDDGRNDDAF